MEQQVIPLINTTIDPTSGETISMGHPLGQHWFNETSGDEFVHKSDGVWVLNSGGSTFTGVTTDSTLTGNGTTNSPLSVVGTVQITKITLTVANWTILGPYYIYVYSNSLITAVKFVDVIPSNETIDVTIAAEILPTTVSDDGSVIIYAKNLPTDNIDITINIYS